MTPIVDVCEAQLRQTPLTNALSLLCWLLLLCSCFAFWHLLLLLAASRAYKQVRPACRKEQTYVSSFAASCKPMLAIDRVVGLLGAMALLQQHLPTGAAALHLPVSTIGKQRFQTTEPEGACYATRIVTVVSAVDLVQAGREKTRLGHRTARRQLAVSSHVSSERTERGRQSSCSAFLVTTADATVVNI
jgi:hypothetical protein